ncbi:MAB_1171c family putative transporter [Streptomyces sp. NPDC021093]|uniref:MAB_1171c family putative transporter n=1 Tax=Streptomyces sp. NPDC021093 TaxID=3365112 RepID=UPI003795F3C2
MQQLLHPICLALAIAGLLALVRSPRRLRNDPSRAALAAAFACSMASFVVSLHPVWRVLDAVLGRPSTGVLLAHSAVVTLLVCQLVVLAHWGLSAPRARRVARRSLLTGAVVIAVLATLFFSLTPVSSSPQNVTAAYAHTPAYQAYMLIYVGAYATGELLLGGACLAVARRDGQPRWVSIGLRVVAVGALLTLGFSIERLAAIIAAMNGGVLPPAAESAAWLFADIGTFLNLGGWFVPVLGVQILPWVRAWVRAPRDYQRLEQLWSAMSHALPHLSFHAAPEPPSDSSALRHRLNWRLYGRRKEILTWHLHRRSVEIRDGQWTLRHHLAPAVRQKSEQRHRAAGLSGRRLAHAVTADQLHAALLAFENGEETPGPTEYADKSVRADVRIPDQDVRALTEIAAHFTVPTQKEREPQ